MYIGKQKETSLKKIHNSRIPNIEKMAFIVASTKKHAENFYRKQKENAPVIDFTAEYIATH